MNIVNSGANYRTITMIFISLLPANPFSIFWLEYFLRRSSTSADGVEKTAYNAPTNIIIIPCKAGENLPSRWVQVCKTKRLLVLALPLC